MSTTTATRARFEIEAENIVHLTADFGRGVETRTYWHPIHGGYVRQIDDAHPGTLGHQVCNGLANSGPTINAAPGQLAAIIRREWRAYKRDMARW